MYLTSEIVNDTLAARRFRLLAPLAVLLALVALALAPGIIGNWRNCATTVGAIPPRALTQLAAGSRSTAIGSSKTALVLARGAVPRLGRRPGGLAV